MQGIRSHRVKKFSFTLLIIFSIALLVFIDQIVKVYLKGIHEKDNFIQTKIIGDFLKIKYTTNDGAALSFLSGKSWAQTFFKILTCVALVGFVIYLIYSLKQKNKLLSISLILIISGTIGNFIDRIRFNYVVDFISFSFFRPIFNIADSFMTIGIVLFVINYLFIDKNALFKKNGN